MKIRKSQLRQAVNEQVQAFFVTPQSMGMVGVRGNAEGGASQLEEDDIDKNELKNIISQIVDDVQDAATKRMQSGAGGRVDHTGKLTEAKWYDSKKKPAVGDKVHIGHKQKGGAGVEGVVTKIEGDRVDIKDPKSKRTFYGKLKNTAVMEISGVDSLKPNDPRTPGADDVEKDAADDVMEAGPKKGGRPRGGPHIDNVRFWDMSEVQLKYIIKDASQAVAANPTARKASKWADEVNDAVTVLYWRKKKGIKEVNTQGAITEGFKEGSNISKLLKKSSTIKMTNPGRRKGIGVKHAVPGRIFVIASRFGSKGITGAGAQDKVSMAVVDKAGKVIKDYGSHVNAKGALKFAKSKGYTQKVNESFNIAPAGQGSEHASVIGTNETPEIGSLASSSKSKELIKKMHDLVTKKLKFKTVEDIQPIQGGVAFIFGDKAESSKMAKYLKKSGALGKVLPMSGERIMVSLRAK